MPKNEAAMSNHSGSHRLNAVLELLEKDEVFKFLGRDRTQQLIARIVQVSWRYDCNPGEILENIGERLGICYDCLDFGEDFHDGACLKCRQSW